MTRYLTTQEINKLLPKEPISVSKAATLIAQTAVECFVAKVTLSLAEVIKGLPISTSDAELVIEVVNSKLQHFGLNSDQTKAMKLLERALKELQQHPEWGSNTELISSVLNNIKTCNDTHKPST